jgi:carbonic anhydrase/acetyltransferase-like protein (isoleucine patch superfamily)
MMPAYALGSDRPVIASSAFLAPGASVIGRVALADNASVWFGATLYGDEDSISVGVNSNVQDGAVLRTARGQPVLIGNNVTVGHQAHLEGCTIGEGSLIGIKAIVHYGAIIGKRCLIGAGAVITEGETYPDGSLIIGNPGRFKRELTAEEFALLDESAVVYVRRHIAYKRDLEIQKRSTL